MEKSLCELVGILARSLPRHISSNNSPYMTAENVIFFSNLAKFTDILLVEVYDEKREFLSQTDSHPGTVTQVSND